MPETPTRIDPSPSHERRAREPEINEYFSSVAKRFRFAKIVTFLLLIVFVLSTIAFNRSEITIENLQYLMKFISFTNTETTISAPKISYSSSDTLRLEIFLGDLCYLSPSGYTLYDSRGNTIMTDSIKYNDPRLCVSEKYALCYDLGGSSFSVFNTFSRLTSGTTDYSITGGDISDSGSFAIATSTREYRTSVELYDSDFKLVSRVLRESWLADLKLSPDGKELAVMTFSSENGSFLTTIDLITIGHDSVRKSISFDGLGYSLFYMDGGFAVIAEDRTIYFDSDFGNAVHEKNFSTLVTVDCSDKYLTRIFNSGIIGNSYKMLVTDVTGRLICESEFDGKLADVSHDESGEYFFVLAGDSVTRINLVNKKIGSVPAEIGGFAILPLSSDSYLVATNNYALTCNFDASNEHYFNSEATDESVS